jgi:hypothetical protein
LNFYLFIKLRRRANVSKLLTLLSAIQEQLLLAIRFWVVNKQHLQQPIAPKDFMAVNQAQIICQQLEDEARRDGEALAKAPNKFKSASDWKVFAEAMDTYLVKLVGSGKIPLKYVTHNQAVADPYAIYATPQAQLIALSLLTEDAFNRDNTLEFMG